MGCPRRHGEPGALPTVTELYRLSVRRHGSRDVAIAVPHDHATARLGTSGRAVILVHGFANSEREAEAAYQHHVRELERVMAPVGLRGVSVFGFHWPGDHPRRIRNVASFSTRIPVAFSAGEKLGRLVEELPHWHEVVLVGHSLGCRVVLAALEYLRSRPAGTGATVPAAFLLAAAVPVGECRPAAIFGDRYASEYVVLHSKRDRVLQFCFSPGAWLFDTADSPVGRAGDPAERWDRRLQTRFGHSDYWPSAEAAKEVATALGGPRTRPVSARFVSSTSLDTREVPEAGPLPSRFLPRR